MDRPIGVLDSGVGGMTVLKSMEKVLGHEDIIYFGDSKNVPYGNRSEDEIFELTMNMLRYFELRNVKLVAIACNTISTIIDRFQGHFKYPIVDIISPTVEHICNMGVHKMVILGTDFTIKTKAYEKLLKQREKTMEIASENSPELASLIDRGDFHSKKIYDTIQGHLDSIKSKGNFYNVVLACTHYPVVEDIFLDIDPTLNYINPGFQQAKMMRIILHNQDMLKKSGQGSVEILTSGNPKIYETMVKKLEIRNVKSISSYDLTQK
ncbi:MAG: glutamate racemase [Gudongella sp.]|nr:glutamate racemase [Gudongella sp.]